ncbi:MAG: MFS transporter [Actinomycetota bacterium]|nr:MFS transporter [Actinomycetota bacterium]
MTPSEKIVRAKPSIAAVRHLLRLHGFRKLFAARIISQLGDGIFQLAATDLLLFKHPGANPAWTLVKLGAVTLIPFSIVVPFVGVFIDRWDRRKILTLTPLGRTALIALVPLASSGSADRPGFYIIVLLVLSANRFFLATMSAVLPQLVADDELLVANSIATTGGSIANVVGLGIGAGLSGLIGGINAGMIGGGAFLAAAFVARLIPVSRARDARTTPLSGALRAVLGELVEGIVHLRHSARATYALTSITVMQALIGVTTATTAVVYINRFHLGVGSVTKLLGLLAVGIFSGVVMVPLVARRVAEERLPVIAFIIGGISLLATSVSLTKGHIVVGSIFAGVSFAFAKIAVDTMVQESLPDEFRGRAFASYDMLYNVARVAGTALAAAAVAEHVHEEKIVVAAGIAYVAMAGVTGYWSSLITRGEDGMPKRIGKDPAGRPVLPALPIGELVTIRAYAGSRADEEPRAIVVGDREIPIEVVEWRAIEERGGERRRIFAVQAAGQRVRLAYNEATSRWEIDRAIRGAGAPGPAGDSQ